MGQEIAVVFGGATGIGAATSRRLARMGLHIAVVAPVPCEELERLCAELVANGEHATPYICDVSDRAAVERLFADIAKRSDRIGCVVNCAGIFLETKAFVPDWHGIERLIAVNLMGGFHVAFSAIDAMREHGGTLVCITSTQGVRGEPGSIVYATTKAAISHFIASLSTELSNTGIRALCVAPGATRTPMTASLHSPETPEMQLILEQLDRRHGGAYGSYFVDPDAIANVIAFAVSADAKALQGVTIVADQGYTAAQPGHHGLNAPTRS